MNHPHNSIPLSNDYGDSYPIHTEMTPNSFYGDIKRPKIEWGYDLIKTFIAIIDRFNFSPLVN